MRGTLRKPLRVANGEGQDITITGLTLARYVDDLLQSLARNTEKTLTVGIILIAFDAEQFAVPDFDPHAAQGRMTVHGTHSRKCLDATDRGANLPKDGTQALIAAYRRARP